MEIEDVIRTYNNYIDTQRCSKGLQTNGYLVVKKNIEKASSFTGNYMNYIQELFYVNGKRKVLKLYNVKFCNNFDVKDAWIKPSSSLLEYLFNLKDTEQFQQILEDTYDSDK